MTLTVILLFLLTKSVYSQQSINDYPTINESLPEAPNSINIYNVTDSTAHVTWTPPRILQNDLLQYQVTAYVIHSYASKAMLYPLKWTYSNNTFKSEIADLQPGSSYNISIKAIYHRGSSNEIFKVINTEIADPDQDPPSPEIVKRDKLTMTIRLKSVENNNGPVSYFRVVVANVNQQQIVQHELLRSYNEALADGLSYYITAELSPEMVNRDFTIGDGKRYNGYYNAPLVEGTEYKVYVGVVSTLNGITKIRHPIGMASINRRLNTSTITNEEGSTLVLGLTIAVVIASILLIVGFIVLLVVRRRFHQYRRQRLSDNQELSMHGPMIQVANHGYITDEDLGHVGHYDALKQKVWNIPRNCLQVNTTAGGDSFLGFGKFGHVVKGTVRKPNEETVMHIACYIITDGDLTNDSKRLMLRQLDILIKSEKHENIASLVGTCETPETVFIAFEHSSLVLKNWLLNNRYSNQTNNKFTTISENELFDILLGIANGMDYLAEKNILHKRLCCRNILISDKLVPKITGHGLSDYNRNNITADYTRWVAQEVLQNKPVNMKSDVWSFGCLMWEASCLGGTPYSQFDGKVVAREVCRGVRLPKLPYIGEEFYYFMLGCWQLDPDERPTFYQIKEQLQYFKETMTLGVHLNFDNLSSDFNFEPYLPIMETKEECISQHISY